MAEGPCLSPGGTSAWEKTCHLPPAPSLPFAWCSPLGSVADTEDFLLLLLLLCYFPFSSLKGRKGWAGEEQLCSHTREEPRARPRAGSRDTPCHICPGLRTGPVPSVPNPSPCDPLPPNVCPPGPGRALRTTEGLCDLPAPNLVAIGKGRGRRECVGPIHAPSPDSRCP